MSRVILLAADRPLPLLEPAFRRVRCTGRFTVETDGFSVRPHEYYRGGVDELGLELKPFQYELDLEATQEDVNALRAYLAGHCRPGEQVELWTGRTKCPASRGSWPTWLWTHWSSCVSLPWSGTALANAG